MEFEGVVVGPLAGWVCHFVRRDVDGGAAVEDEWWLVPWFVVVVVDDGIAAEGEAFGGDGEEEWNVEGFKAVALDADVAVVVFLLVR